jgi:serine/threonine-protein kinase RsbT
MLPIRAQTDLVAVRQRVRQLAVEVGLSLVEQTKLVTAASELARNTLDHGRGGTARLEVVEDGARRGVKLTFVDSGPGIADVEQALRDGFSTAGGMGLGLGGARRLSHDFQISSRAGEGTTVSITRWR